MSDREHHCPFLNRADHRCSAFFSIERLQHAFEHCFDAYQACDVYRELLVERQARRSEAAASAAAGTAGGAPHQAPGRFLWTTACTSPNPDVTTRFVRIRLPHAAPPAGHAQEHAQGHAHVAAGAAAANAGAGADGYAKPAA
jgi:hypothetical protein